MSCEAVGYLTIMQLTANVYLVVARPCRSGWSLWLNQLAGQFSHGKLLGVSGGRGRKCLDVCGVTKLDRHPA